MRARARRGMTPHAESALGRLGDEGAERYMWVVPEGDHIVLAIPGLRNLKLDATEARTIGEMLIQAADEMVKHHRNQRESGDNNSPEERLTEG
jgi:hypothetical protein